MLCITFERMFIVVPDRAWRDFQMADLREQHIYVKFCFRLRKAASEAQKKAVGDSAMERTQIFEWFSLFRRGENGRRWWSSGRLSADRTDGNMEKAKKIANENRWSTISGITGRLSLLYGTCQRILLRTCLSLRDACVTYWWAEAAACACVSETVEWSQKRSIFTLEGHNRGRNLGLL